MPTRLLLLEDDDELEWFIQHHHGVCYYINLNLVQVLLLQLSNVLLLESSATHEK